MAATVIATKGLEASPAYTAIDSTQVGSESDNNKTGEKPPPAYPVFLPDQFPIGAFKVPSVVLVSELQCHLRILGAFSMLRKAVEGTAEKKDEVWAIFIARAVYRFHQWASSIWPESDGTIQDDAVPPIDVLMVWHSYMLVSCIYIIVQYYESLEKMFPRYH